MKPIARISSPFTTKFGIPRQSGLVQSLRGKIIFEPEYRVPEAFRGLEGYSHIWLLWEFSEAKRDGWSPTVRPPRLGGNKRVGVFATRSPFRPNSIGLSVVKLERIEYDSPEGVVLHINGADLMDGTPIYDIKPYLPHIESIPDARAGFSAEASKYRLCVDIPEDIAEKIPPEHRNALLEALAQDPRPSYQNDPERVYGFAFAGMEVKFRVDGGTLYVTDAESASDCEC